MQHEVPGGDVRLPIEKQVLRAAEGHEQGTADGGDVLERQHGKDVLFLSGTAEQQDRQRYEDDQRDIVGHKHGREEDTEDQEKGQGGHPFHP